MTVTAGTCGPTIAFALASGFGRPIENPSAVSANDSGSGNTGCGSLPNTSPLNQRFVGGTRPAASRTGVSFAAAEWSIFATSAAGSTTGSAASGGPSATARPSGPPAAPTEVLVTR